MGASRGGGQFAGARVSRENGVRVDFADSWVHIDDAALTNKPTLRIEVTTMTVLPGSRVLLPIFYCAVTLSLRFHFLHLRDDL